MSFAQNHCRFCKSRQLGFGDTIRVQWIVGEGCESAVGCEQQALGTK